MDLVSTKGVFFLFPEERLKSLRRLKDKAVWNSEVYIARGEVTSVGCNVRIDHRPHRLRR
jgi:hypothetical protein